MGLALFTLSKSGKSIYGGTKNVKKYEKWFKKYFADASESTVNGGAGDDTIIADGFAPRAFEYKTGDGNDVYYHFNDNESGLDSHLSTIHITKGKIDKITLGNVKLDSSDVMINVGNGSIRLVKGDDKKFKIREADGTTTTLAYKCDSDKGDTICSIFGGDSNEVIKDTISGAIYRNALDGGGGDDLLIGTVKEDTLVGRSGKDTLDGGKNDDKLYGGSGNDSLIGGDGNDKLFGEADNDILRGGDGKDTLNGGAGNDKLWGDAGADTFIYSFSDGKDVIYGFDNSDTLTLDTLLFDTSYNKLTKTVSFKFDDGGYVELKNFTATTFHVITIFTKSAVQNSSGNNLNSKNFYRSSIIGGRFFIGRIYKDFGESGCRYRIDIVQVMLNFSGNYSSRINHQT